MSVKDLWWKLFHWPDTGCPICFQYEAGHALRVVARAYQKVRPYSESRTTRAIRSVVQGHQGLMRAAMGIPDLEPIDSWAVAHYEAYGVTGYSLYLERAMRHVKAGREDA